ncbi:ATP-binding protein [Oligoflexus tunisiensis]|uniref:ATP-binding protein n=1 Tax=Oligoflexus tunisiensis TaxID=708132 RepID=UPI00159F22A7|nr:ATP-binding protein [Oligoflexus tunisiensis]
MRVLFLALLLLLPLTMQAAQAPRLDQSYDELFKSMMDDPRAINQWARTQLTQDGLETREPFHWAKAMAIYLSSCMEIGCEDDSYATEENIKKAIAIAEKQADKPLLIRLHLMMDGINTDSGVEVTDFRSVLEPIKKLAEDNGGGRLLADVYREYAAAAESESNLQLALIYAKNALELAEDYGYPGDILPILIKNDSAILASRMGDHEKSVVLYQQVIEYCKLENIRHMGAIALINLGRNYTRQDNPETIRKGLTYFDQADVAIQGLNEDRLAAFSELTRGEALLNLKDYGKAHVFIDAALKKFKKLDSIIWTADSLHWKARVYLAQKRWAEALKYLNESDALFPEHLQNDKAQLAQERADALMGLKRPIEAFRSLQQFIDIHQKIDEKSKKEQLNELQVKFGYQLKEQENQLLKKENQIKEHQLREADLIKTVAVILGFLILVCLLLLFFALLQVRKTRQAKARIQYILDNIEEGIITVGRDLKVESSLSPYLDHVIGHDAPDSARQNVMLYLLEKSELKADERHMIREVITSCIDEPALVWELNVGNLPQTLTLDHGERIISLHWQPLYGKDKKIRRIIVAMRDITRQHKLELEIDQARTQRGRLQHIMEEVARLSPQRYQQFIQGSVPRAEKIRQGGSALRDLLPELHSLKGEARSLGLRDLAAITHQLEDLLDGRHQIPPSDDAIREAIHLWQDVWRDYQSFALLMSARESQPAGLEGSSLVQILADQWGSLQMHCKNLGIPLHRVQIDEEIFEWNRDVRQAIKDVLLHSIINSIDHGFKDQTDIAKPELHVRLQRSAQGQIQLSVQDNGRGLNWTRLQELIKERNFVPEPGQSLADVVFLEGLSTAAEVSQTSGRGVGLSAIRRIARTFKGDVHIKDRENQPGCELVIELMDSAS